MNKRDWLQRLPKAEYHLHIEGAIPWSMVVGSAGDPLPPHPAWLEPDHRFDDFNDFRQVMQTSRSRVIQTVAGYHRVAHAHFQQLVANNVRYVEPSIHTVVAYQLGASLEAVADAILTAAPPNLTVRLYAGFPRNDYSHDADFMRTMVPQALGCPLIEGIDIHGDERHSTIDQFVAVYAEARRRGLGTKAHAGEMRGAASINEVLDKLHPQRIQHGVTALEDEALVERLAADGVRLDMAPISNLKLRVIPTMAAHPIGTYYDAGISVTINTDDPAVFNCTLTDELVALVEHEVLTLPELAEIQRQAFRDAAITAADLAAIEREIDDLLAELGR